MGRSLQVSVCPYQPGAVLRGAHSILYRAFVRYSSIFSRPLPVVAPAVLPRITRPEQHTHPKNRRRRHRYGCSGGLNLPRVPRGFGKERTDPFNQPRW